MHHSPISSKRTIRTHVVGKQTVKRRLERAVTGRWRGAASALHYVALASRRTRVPVPPLNLIR